MLENVLRLLHCASCFMECVRVQFEGRKFFFLLISSALHKPHWFHIWLTLLRSQFFSRWRLILLMTFTYLTFPRFLKSYQLFARYVNYSCNNNVSCGPRELSIYNELLFKSKTMKFFLDFIFQCLSPCHARNRNIFQDSSLPFYSQKKKKNWCKARWPDIFKWRYPVTHKYTYTHIKTITFSAIGMNNWMKLDSITVSASLGTEFFFGCCCCVW